jgi:hypothetical protein
MGPRASLVVMTKRNITALARNGTYMSRTIIMYWGSTVHNSDTCLKLHTGDERDLFKFVKHTMSSSSSSLL